MIKKVEKTRIFSISYALGRLRQKKKKKKKKNKNLLQIEDNYS